LRSGIICNLNAEWKWDDKVRMDGRERGVQELWIEENRQRLVIVAS